MRENETLAEVALSQPRAAAEARREREYLEALYRLAAAAEASDMRYVAEEEMV